MITLTLGRLQVQDDQRHPLGRRHRPDLLGMQTSLGLLALQRPGITDQDQIAGTEAAPGDLFQGLENPGIGVLVELVGGDLGLGERGSPSEKIELGLDLGRIDEEPRHILQLPGP